MDYDKISNQLVRDEGEVLTEYKDHLGFSTIGVGRLIDKRRGGGITKEESRYLLKNDIESRIMGLRQSLKFFDKLDEARQGVLINMAFQLGLAGLLGFKQTLALVEKGAYKEASKAMIQSKWATQTPARAKRMAQQMLSGEWQ